MNVLVIGANGQIGKQLVEKIAERKEHQVTAMIRNPEQADLFAKMGAETVTVSLEDRVEKIAEAMAGKDAVVFTAGSGGSTGLDKTLLVDLDGAGKSIEAAEKSGVSRFIMVSALQAHNRENWSEAIKPYYAAKHYADEMLKNSGLNYTIIRPGGLLNEAGTGKVSIAENLERNTIPRADVAETAYYSLNEPSVYRRSFDLTSGTDEIPAALKSL